MYASEQLKELADRKELLRARIALRRMQLVVSSADLARPLAVVDRGIELWRQFSPMLKMLGIPLSILGLRGIFGRSSQPAGEETSRRDGKGWISILFAALPTIIQVFRAFSSAPSSAAAGSSSKT